MALFYIIIFFGLFVILAALGLLGTIFRFFFGSSSSKQPGEKKDRWYAYNNKKRKKVFKETDGEYVDFEEVKDSNKDK